MGRLTLSANAQTRADVEVAKKFFGTVSADAAIRSAILLAQHVTRTAKDRTILVHDLNQGGFLRVKVQ